MKKYLAEFIGTFFLVMTVGMTVIGGKGDFAPFAVGAVLMVMVFAGGHVSGAHYNPAVTFAVLLRGKISIGESIGYWIVQLLAAAAASATVMYLLNEKIPVSPMNLADTGKALLAELIGTFALAYVVLNVTTAQATAGNSYYGLAIGFTVLAMAYSFGRISGSAFNPAVAVGICLLKLISWSNFWIYLLGCFSGAALAAFVFRLNHPGEA
jgi:aquaporin Z